MFCNQCGNQIPDGSAVCPNCGAQLAQPAESQPVNNGMPQGQPMYNGMPQGQPINNGMPQGQPMYNGMPQQGQPMYNGMPMQQPQSNPLEFLTKTYPGVPFPMKGLFSKANLIAKGFTMNLIGVIGAIVAFICVFLPILSISSDYKDYFDGSFTMMSELTRDQLHFNTGWILIVLSVLMLLLYVLRYEFAGFLAAVLNVLMFIHTWSVFGFMSAQTDGGAPLGVGFYFYLLATIACIAAPFIWGKIKKY